MWNIFARIIIRKRWFILAVLVGLTGMFGYYTTKINLSRSFTDNISTTDTNSVVFHKMRKIFGEEGMVVVIGIKDKNLYTPAKFKAWHDLGQDLKKIEGVDSVFSEAYMYYLVADTSNYSLKLQRTYNKFPTTQAELDTLKAFTRSQPFFQDLLFNDSSGTSLMMVFVDPKKFNSKERGDMVPDIIKTTDRYKSYFKEFRYSGLPLVRDTLFRSLNKELILFVILSLVASALILYFFFRSFTVLAICLCTVAIGLIWSFGSMGFMQYKVTALMSLVPPLMIIIAIPNSIYIINKYHQEFVKARNKLKALRLVIYKLGAASFITNANTALGFLTFLFTGNAKLVEFGIVTCFNVMAMFFIALTFIPIMLTFVKAPSEKTTKHLEKKWITRVVDFLSNLVLYKRKWVYGVTIGITVATGVGIFFIRTTGNISSDLPVDSPVVQDLKFFEKEFGGIMPIEIVINAREKGQIVKDATLEKIDSIQQYLKKFPIYSKSISIVDAVKLINSAIHQNNLEKYTFMDRNDKRAFLPYRKELNKQRGAVKSFVDSSETLTRITSQMADIGSVEIAEHQAALVPVIDSILNPDKVKVSQVLRKLNAGELEGQQRIDAVNALLDNNLRFRNKFLEELAGPYDTSRLYALDADPELVNKEMGRKDVAEKLSKAYKKSSYEVQITGTSTLFAIGTNYMINDMIQSLIFAIITISALMFFLFTSMRMIIISLVPNIIPQIMVAGLMGVFDLPLKPSTILVFSLAYGISVDNSIHFLAKYRQELKAQHFNIKQCVLVSLRETFLSQVYTSLVLLLGFSMFCFSSFGATVALGVLVSLSLFIAMFCNLIILPALLLSLDRYIAIKAYQEPFLAIYDEEEDIELADLEIEKLEEEEPEI